MARKHIIGSILILFALLELLALEIHRSYYEKGIYGFTEEMFLFLIGIFIFLMLLSIGALIFRKRKLIYWSMSWAMTSVIVGILSLWTFILSENPTANGWGGFAQSAIYYVIGSLQGQTATSLAVLAFCTSKKLRSRPLLVVAFLCLFFSSVIILLYTGRLVLMFFTDITSETVKAFLYAILLNILPLSVIVSLILILLREKSEKIINKAN